MTSLMIPLLSLTLGCIEGVQEGQDLGGGWIAVLGGLDGGLVGVWAPGDDDVWTVGADPDDGLGAYVFHYDGVEWTRMENDIEGNLWWVHGDDDGTVWMIGESGRIARYHPDSGFETMESPAEINLFGALAFAEDDVWACGGNNLSIQEKQVLWHYDGESWDTAPGFENPRETDAVLTKVFGTSSDDLWVVGGPDEGLHLKDGEWSVVDMGTDEYLTTVHGNDNLLVAAGGETRGILIENRGSGWESVDLGDVQPLNGVAVHADGRAVASGWFGSLHLRDRDGNWSPVDEVEIRSQVFHSVAVSPGGDVYAAGALFGVVDIYDGVLVKGRLAD